MDLSKFNKEMVGMLEDIRLADKLNQRFNKQILVEPVNFFDVRKVDIIED